MGFKTGHLARLAPAAGMFVLSVIVGEYLFGNLSIDALWLALILMPMYGGGVLLVREGVRRLGYGWPAIFLLGLAYGVIEEGISTQLLFRPSYSTYGVYLDGPTYLPGLGLNVIITLSVLTLHALWSICVPIALVESLVPERSREPWLGKLGLTIAAMLFVGGVAYVRDAHAQSPKYSDFDGTTGQFVGSLIVAALLVALACWRPRRSSARVPGRAPHPWIVGLVSLIGTTLLMVFNVWTLGRELTRQGPLSGWVSVGAWIGVVVVLAVLIARWSRYEGWGARHELALAGGATLTYAWIAFPQVPHVGSTGVVDLIGNVLFASGAIVLLAVAARRIGWYERGLLTQTPGSAVEQRS